MDKLQQKDMERLKGKEIFIGKEPHKHRLLVAVKNGGQIKTATLGTEGSVPNCVSRCIPSEGKAHCKIVVGQDGIATVHNLKVENVTYVNGMEIETKDLSNQCKVMLGKDKYPVNIKSVMDTVKGLIPVISDVPSGHSIRHLQRIWEKYEADLYHLQKRQKNLGLIKSLYMPCTVLSVLVGFVLKYSGLESSKIELTSMAMYVVAAIVLFYGLYKTFTDKSLEERKLLDKKFQEDYVCPNCKHFLGVKPYSLLRQDECCPYKRCKWTE